MQVGNLERKSVALLIFLFLVSGSVSAQQFGGLPWQLEFAVILCALTLTVVAFLKPDIPVLGIISTFFWIYAGIASAKVIFYTQDGTKITNMDFYHLIYLFGLMGIIMIVHTLYCSLWRAKETIEEYEGTPRGRLNKTI